MDMILKISISRVEQGYIDSVLEMVKKIETGHPDLFRRVEVVIKC